MKLILTAMDNRLFDAWTRHCGDLDEVSIHRGSILDLACDAVFSPANSFGFMDGGIDAYYLDHFGEAIQARVRRAILGHHLHHGGAGLRQDDKHFPGISLPLKAELRVEIHRHGEIPDSSERKLE